MAGWQGTAEDSVSDAGMQPAGTGLSHSHTVWRLPHSLTQSRCSHIPKTHASSMPANYGAAKLQKLTPAGGYFLLWPWLTGWGCRRFQFQYPALDFSLTLQCGSAQGLTVIDRCPSKAGNRPVARRLILQDRELIRC